MLTLPTLTDRIANEMNSERAKNIRTLNHRIRVTNRYISRLLSRRDDLIAERAGLLMAAERDAIRELVELTAGETIQEGDSGEGQVASETPVVQLRGDDGAEDPERFDGLS